MLAVSRDHAKIVVHDPGDGLDVPLTIDLDLRQVVVALPSIDTLENGYFAVETLGELKRAVRGHAQFVDLSVRFSRYYSRRFRAEIDAGTTIAKLRRMIVDHYRAIDVDDPPVAIRAVSQNAKFDLATAIGA